MAYRGRATRMGGVGVDDNFLISRASPSVKALLSHGWSPEDIPTMVTVRAGNRTSSTCFPVVFPVYDNLGVSLLVLENLKEYRLRCGTVRVG